jgi:unsaturated rhamnogalacturonyl hydrolase
MNVCRLTPSLLVFLLFGTGISKGTDTRRLAAIQPGADFHARSNSGAASLLVRRRDLGAVRVPHPMRDAQSGAAASDGIEAHAAAVASLAGEPHIVSAAGVTRDDRPLLTLENPSAFDPAARQRRLVLVGGLDGSDDSARIVLDAVRWFKTAAPARDRTNWAVSALPMANPAGRTRSQPYTFPPLKGFFDHPEQPESRYVWRWVAYQAPDLVVEVRLGRGMQILHASASGAERALVPTGSLAREIADPSDGSDLGAVTSMRVTARPSDGASVMRGILARAPGGRSNLRETVSKRISRDALVVARRLAQRYPGAPTMIYIPAVAWGHTLKLASITGDASLRAKVLAEVQPWLAAEKPLFGERVQLAAVAGTMIFAELAKVSDANRDAASRLAADGFTRAAAEKAPGVPQLGTAWTDDMFMGTVVLARAGTAEGRAAATRLLATYAGRLQRSDGLFNHAPDAPVAWGRGNGFAALGLTEALSVLAENDAARPTLLEIYRRHMAAMQGHQAPDGMWRQVVDVPGSYRELSVTAMTVSAMATGVRRGWLDRSYLPVVERAWRALLSHIVDDGTVVDVCTSTGAGPTLRYYLDRPAVTGADDRGGAFALGAALDMYELRERF